ncbi:apolipoprotein N-acyltransferase [Spirulina sp. CS-785/01]|uniref:apolipoprotein N-acyltransferase n=1 Tax=Spirulina sp. CS-785/01 TaxID=3021716 RepID=UPI00232AFB38|nr:apolipoprotein N-acyltransferase [Spirulina sp. CS-785/01]MDB9315976.1 apolipoprotein N-acyltransferase [Spirulina sp. CS-785/01]
MLKPLQRHRFYYGLIPLLAGVTMGLTPAPVNAFPLAWVALIPLWRWGQLGSWRQAAWYGLLWGVGYHGLALAWITGIHPMTWLGVSWWNSIAIAIFAWSFITLWGAALVALWALLFNQLQPTHNKTLSGSLWRVLLGTTLWCGLEVIWRATPLWWSSLAYTQSPHNLLILHLGQLSGTTAVTAALVCVNGLLAEALASRHRQTLLTLALSSCLLFHGFGWTLYRQPLAQDNPIRVGIIQGNIANDIKLSATGWRKALTGYTDGYLQLVEQGAEVVLTPETALPFYWEDITRQQQSFYQTVKQQGIPAWLGAYGKVGQNYTNSLFTLTGDGETLSQYDKVKLVPLGEYIPLQNLLGSFIDRLSPLDAHLIPGQPSQVFDTPFGRAIVGICYESAFDYHFQRQTRRGGEFILTASNNAHYSETMPAQHHALDVMRAIESDRWAARATNTGYSAIVTPHGQALWRSGINTYETHLGTIHRRTTQTFYGRWGDWLIWVFLAVTGLLWVIQFRQKG